MFSVSHKVKLTLTVTQEEFSLFWNKLKSDISLSIRIIIKVTLTVHLCTYEYVI